MSKSSYGLIYNIPMNMRSKHLRKFFLLAIEEQAFKCFHFRHRKSATLISKMLKLEPNTYACFIKMASREGLQRLISCYHNKRWAYDNPNACNVVPIITTDEEFEATEDNLTEPLINVDCKITIKRLKRLSEMRPPRLLRKGNVGTPLHYILELIRHCKMPTSTLVKLGISLQDEFYKRKYACFFWDYENSTGIYSMIAENKDYKPQDTTNPHICDEPAEEWERHEALHDDPFNMTPKERLFESEQEVVWEKGSSGLVWYTDAQYWTDLEGNDEKETDDWDMIPDDDDDEFQLTEKIAECNSISNKSNKFFTQKQKLPLKVTNKLENGFGGMLLKKYGWKIGQGLGLKNRGITEAIPCDGQTGLDKRGFGYRGQKLFNFKVPEVIPDTNGITLQ